jgi:hypothetical protein
MDPVSFLEIVSPNKGDPIVFKIGTIPATYTSGRPTVKFDGESAASVRLYAYLSSYTPAANDRVLIALVGHSGVILGKII